MTQYLEAKEYFTDLAKVEKVAEAKQTMRIYKKMRKRNGDFVAARFILDVYQTCNEELEN